MALEDEQIAALRLITDDAQKLRNLCNSLVALMESVMQTSNPDSPTADPDLTLADLQSRYQTQFTDMKSAIQTQYLKLP